MLDLTLSQWPNHWTPLSTPSTRLRAPRQHQERAAALCPYRGLEAFREEHAAFFAGRGAFASELCGFTLGKQAIAATRYLLHLFQTQLEAKGQRKLRRLTQRLLNIDHELDRLSSKNECTLAVNECN